ncbi:MAG: lipid-A-disaccharide synthase [Proteobacteria bacterium]|nr:MAG: lipid-A-disaccharide synthase [Pseudomonadota bacterium]
MRRIAIIAGEASGDLLAARLIKALLARYPDLQFEGIAGPEMQAAGCRSFFPMEKLSVMGLVEVLKDLPELLSIRKQLLQTWRADPPDLFIGVDAPDFNLPLAAKLHDLGVATVHYVSPSIWAWRERRIKKIQGHIDLMLTLFPFEVDFYQRHGVNARFVGHPLADEIVFDADKVSARQALGLHEARNVLAVLPGSRRSEVKALGAVFLQTAWRLQQQYPDLQIVIPIVRPALQLWLETIRHKLTPALQVHYLQGQSRTLMQAADYILLASGTAALEAMLAGRLMVAAYRVSELTRFLLRVFRLLKVRYVTLPNHMADEALIPELLQQQANVPELLKAMQELIALPPERQDYLLKRFQEMQQQLQGNASKAAADAIVDTFL